jgi:monoamine oxidase
LDPAAGGAAALHREPLSFVNAEPDIAIIGAGAAGIGAARRLAGSGLSVLVLEALPRLGGRAWTRHAAGMPLDMPLDMGCEWLHSGDRNVWTGIAEANGFAVDRRTAGWNAQYRDLGFSPAERDAAFAEFAAWEERLAAAPPASDCAADALDPHGKWTAFLQALSGYISGDELERISARDYAAYDHASTDCNWRLPAGYGTLIAASFPAGAELRLDTRVEAITLDARRVGLRTAGGDIRPRAVILTAATDVLARGAIALPSALDPWREAASFLPLGRDEKLFLQITGDSPFAPESHVIGDPQDPATGSYNIRPFGRPVIGCFLGGAGARRAAAEGERAAFARAIDQLAALFGNDVRGCLQPLLASDWAGTPGIGGAYSHALPGYAGMRQQLARPFDNRLFFAGEATHATDFSTAHGAYESGLRAADEAILALSAIA